MLRIGLACAAVLILPGCFSPSSVTCGPDGPTCPAGWQCTADNLHCINPQLTLCGNGTVDSGEQCDDGNLDNHDGCNWDCRDPRCGDGLVDGDEVCDDGNTTNGDGCSADCMSIEVCGDGYVNGYTHTDANGASVAPEECDDGGVDTATCNADCSNAVCGDGKVNAAANEECDGGSPAVRQPVDTATCDDDCTFAVCGDAYVNAKANEQCDNGLYCVDGTPCTTAADCAGLTGDTECTARDFGCCTHTCQNPLCGDGVLQPDCQGFPLEVCDDGRFCADGTSCVGAAQCAGIGDGACKTRNGTGCSADCLSPETCGDGVVNDYPPYNEVCDDGRHCADLVTPCTSAADCAGIGDGQCEVRSGTGCSDDCKSREVCGDGYLNAYPRVDAQGDPAPAEVCDDGRQCADGTACTASSECAGIGDGACRTRSADDCSADCLSKEVCGDGYVNDYPHTVVNQQPVCTPLLGSCPAEFQGLTTTGQPFQGTEACDDGNTIDGDGCSSDCLSAEKCGDGYLNDYPPYNEICDDGNNDAGDGCAPDCKSTEQCGNGVTDPGEECDDGAALNGTSASPNGCSASCAFIRCGNARKDPGEQCDEGHADPSGAGVVVDNSDTGRCLTSCVCNVCGDGAVNGASGASSDCPDSRLEQCDSGGVNDASCNFDCTLPACGDGIVNFSAGELCDNGPAAPAVAGETAESAACNADCSLAFCGDGKVNRARGEVCDDGNNTSGDGCSADCKSEEVCGDGIVNAYAVDRGAGSVAPPEVCDLGRFCQDLSACTADADCAGIGDGVCAPRDGVGCSADCRSKELCGDSYLNANETCDDGNAAPDDGCGADCETESGWACPTVGEPCHEVCGDGLVVGSETCDDGAQCQDGTACTTDADCAGIGDALCQPRAGDGCDASCTLEVAWSCPTAGGTGGACTAVCGDFVIRGAETCDDGMQCEDGTPCVVDSECLGVGDALCAPRAGDGCDASCQKEGAWACPSDGFTVTVGGTCEPICGDGLVRGDETCDDGGRSSGDGCDSGCSAETGWDCPLSGGVGGACTPTCGDGLVRGDETCDEGAAPPSGGCTACAAQSGWSCPTTLGVGGLCATVCGDGLVRGDEQCDAGLANDDHGDCTTGCATATCSDGFVHSLGSGTETDVDCGGTACGACANASSCLVDGDCQSHYCEPLSRTCRAVPAPIAGDDAATALETATTLDLAVATDLLGNDAGYDAATFSADGTSSCGAAVSTSGDRSHVTYTLPADPSACATPYRDAFTYTVCSPHDGAVCATATVAVTLNRLPTLDVAFSCVPVGTTRDALDVTPLFNDADGNAVGQVDATGAGGLPTVAGAVVTWAPDDRDAAASYTVALDICDDAAVPGCAASSWTAVWDDPPVLADLATTPANVRARKTVDVPYATMVSSYGAVEGVPVTGDPLASVAVSASASGPFDATATTALGTCAVDDANSQVQYTAGGTSGADSCFVQVCEACGATPLCEVTELAVVIGPDAVDDQVTVVDGSPATGAFTVASLLANDVDAHANTFALVAGATSCGGAVALGSDTVAYTGPADPSACAVPYQDSFEYSVCNASMSACSTATVTVAINRPPTVADSFSCIPLDTPSATLDVSTVFTDPDGDNIDAASVDGTSPDAGAVSANGVDLTWTPTTPATADAYQITATACDDASAPGCGSGTWTAVWDDPPSLADLATTPTTVAASASADFPYTTVIVDTGAVAGVASGDPIASVTVSDASGGTFDTTAITTLGTCAVDSANGQVVYTAGATAGDDSCFVKVCEACGTTPVCAVTELAVTVTP